MVASPRLRPPNLPEAFEVSGSLPCARAAGEGDAAQEQQMQCADDANLELYRLRQEDWYKVQGCCKHEVERKHRIRAAGVRSSVRHRRAFPVSCTRFVLVEDL